MRTSHAPGRYRAVSMELAAYLDEHCVEMHILSDTGESIAVACPSDSIFAVQRHIGLLGHQCPEIATWGTRSKSADCVASVTNGNSDTDAGPNNQAIISDVVGLCRPI
jgi:hypothetical protein